MTRKLAEMTKQFSYEQMQKVYETNLIEYAKSQGFEVKRADRKSYHVKGYGGLYLFSNAYHHFSNVESGGIIDFVMNYQGLSKDDAIEHILSVQGISPIIPPFRPKPKGTLILPKKAENNNSVISYLVNERCLDPHIVDSLIQQGKIYQAVTTNKGTVFHNCAFVAFDNQNKPKYCALRGLGKSNFRQDVTNSDKTYGFTLAGTSNRVFTFEAPIDAISHATLCKLNGLDYMTDGRISEGCLSDKALERFLKRNPQINEIVFCFDNDVDGKDYKGNPHNHGQIFAQKCAEKFSKKGYTTHIQTPTRKDFNADLQYIQKSVVNELRSRKTPTPQRDKGDVKPYER